MIQDGSKSFTLTNDSDRHTSTVEIEARYVPVPVKLDPRESINSEYYRSVRLTWFSVAIQIRATFGSISSVGMISTVLTEEVCTIFTVFKIILMVGTRQIGSVCHLHAEWAEGVQVADDQEDSQSRLERGLHHVRPIPSTCGVLLRSL